MHGHWKPLVELDLWCQFPALTYSLNWQNFKAILRFFRRPALMSVRSKLIFSMFWKVHNYTSDRNVEAHKVPIYINNSNSCIPTSLTRKITQSVPSRSSRPYWDYIRILSEALHCYCWLVSTVYKTFLSRLSSKSFVFHIEAILYLDISAICPQW